MKHTDTALIVEMHPAFHLNIGTAYLIKRMSGHPSHPFAAIVATDHAGPEPVSGPWDDVPILSLFRPKSVFPNFRIGLGLMDPLAFSLQRKRVERFLKERGIKRLFILIANNARFAGFAAQLAPHLPRDVYIVDDFIADSHIYRVDPKTAQKALNRLVTKSERVFTISPLYAQDLEEEYGRPCEFLPILVNDRLLEFHKDRTPVKSLVLEHAGDNGKNLTIHHAGQIHHLYAGALAEFIVVLRRTAREIGKQITLELYGNIQVKDIESLLNVDLAVEGPESKGPFKINVCGEVSMEELTDAQKGADFLLLVNSFEPVLKKQIRCSFSSKVCEYMASGVPILVYAPDYSSLTAYLGENNAAHLITQRDPEQIRQRLKEIIADPTRTAPALAARQLAVDNHSGKAFFDRIAHD